MGSLAAGPWVAEETVEVGVDVGELTLEPADVHIASRLRDVDSREDRDTLQTNLLGRGDWYTPVLARCGLVALATVRDLTNRRLRFDALANVRSYRP